MRTADLDRIERDLGVRLPASYRAALEAYPLPRDEDSTSLWLVEDADEVIQETREFRSHAAWPESYVYIGRDGSEYVYFLDVARDPSPVMRYDHETGTHDVEEAPDMASHIEQCQRAYAGIEADVVAINERYHKRRWWEFWIRPYPERGDK